MLMCGARRQTVTVKVSTVGAPKMPRILWRSAVGILNASRFWIDEQKR